MPVIQNGGGGGQSADETIAQDNQEKLQREQAQQAEVPATAEQQQAQDREAPQDEAQA